MTDCQTGKKKVMWHSLFVFVHVSQKVNPEPGRTTKTEIISHPYRESSIQLLKHNKKYMTHYWISTRYWPI